MTRVHADPVEVVRKDADPEQFRWRGRLYLVREVLARWTESGGWWRSAAVSAMASGDSALVQAAPELDDGERDWWRVEAGSGRSAVMTAGPGVYDLCFDWSRGSWSLARVLD